MSKKSRQERRRARMKASRAANRRGVSSDHRTLAAVEEYLKSRGLSVCGDPEKGCLSLDLTFYPPDAVTYRNEEGYAACKVIVTASEDGQSVKIASPNVWNLRDCPHRASVYETLVRKPREMPIVRFLHDPETDGVTSFSVVSVSDRGVSDDLITEGLGRVIHAIPMWDPVIRRAMTTGEVSVPSLPDSGEVLSPDEVRRIRHDLSDQLAEEVKARWQQVRQIVVAKAGENGLVAIPEEPQSNYLLGTAVFFVGGRVLALVPTLPAEFERIVNTANQLTASVISQSAKVVPEAGRRFVGGWPEGRW